MNGSFLSAVDRADLVKIARDGLEEHRIARRANAVLLLDKGWSFAEVAEALLLDDSTVRVWLKEFQEGGVEALVLFDLKGGTGGCRPSRSTNCAPGRRRGCRRRPPKSGN